MRSSMRVLLCVTIASLSYGAASPTPLEFRGFKFGNNQANGDAAVPVKSHKSEAPMQKVDKCAEERQKIIERIESLEQQVQSSLPPHRKPSSVPSVPQVRTAPDTCRVLFRLKNEGTQPGDTLLALGNAPPLGNWQAGGGLVFTTTANTFPWWHAEAVVPPGTELEFKFVMKKASGDLLWEQGQNRRLEVVRAEGMKVETSFGDMRSNVDVEGEAAQPARAEEERAIVEAQVVQQSQEVSNPQAGELVEGGKELTARLYFRVRCETKPGENVGVCGSVESIGAWSPEKALSLKTTADEYPFWSGSAEVSASQVQQVLKYKYLIKHPQGEWWEDGIADRTLEKESAGAKGGVLSAGLDTYVDDGSFNVLQRVCTYVREREASGDKPKLQIHAIEEGKPFEVPEGYQLVTLEQVLQWTAQLEDLETECQSWRDRIESAESTIVVLTAEIEGKYLRILQKHKQIREEGQARKYAFLKSMDNAEAHLDHLEQTCEKVQDKKRKLRTPVKLRSP